MDAGDQERLDKATSQRLHRLADMSVDPSRVEERLLGVLDRSKPRRPMRFPNMAWRSVASVAAVVAVAVVIGVVTLSGPRALASPMALSRVHENVVAGLLPIIDVNDIPAARAQLQALAAGEPRPKGEYPLRVRCCCGQELNGEQLAFLRLQHGDSPLTIVLMRGYHVCAGHDDHAITDSHGRRLIVHQENAGVQATLTAGPDRWICVMGGISADELVSVASGLVF